MFNCSATNIVLETCRGRRTRVGLEEFDKVIAAVLSVLPISTSSVTVDASVGRLVGDVVEALAGFAIGQVCREFLVLLYGRRRLL